MAAKITLSSIAQRKTDIVDANIDGETVMMSIENGEYYGLDTVASDIWAMLEMPIQVESICQRLMTDYDVSKETCITDVLQFLNQLQENEIIEVSI